jgi:sirohydrochlorin ferrochelatase
MDCVMQTGIIIVDHGSRRKESNQMLEELAGLFAQRFQEKYGIVEPAHMEIAEPSIATAYARCAERGAQRVVVCPFFLGPGKHWTGDIPRLTAQAAQRFPQTTYHVTPFMGIDDLILDLLDKRIAGCEQNAYSCELCRGTLRSGEKGLAIPAAEH